MANTIHNEQTTGLKRDTTDKYYTSNEAVALCMSHIQTHIQISPDDICIEPSAGDGSFINAIKSAFAHHRFYDLEPAHSEVEMQDYLSFEFVRPARGQQSNLVSRQSNLASQGLRRSAEQPGQRSNRTLSGFARALLGAQLRYFQI